MVLFIMRYTQLLPTKENTSVKDYFQFLPFSIIRPTKQSKAMWKTAYLDDDFVDERKGYGIRKNGVSKMSEFHAGMAEHIIRYWSMKNMTIVDPFAGRATRAVVSSTLHRNYNGYEISPSTYKRCLKHFKKHNIKCNLFNSSGIDMKNTADFSADMVFTCPPYFDIEKYEDVENQLSNIKQYDDFKRQIDICFKNCFRVLKDGCFCVWVVADFRKNCKLVPFHVDCILSAMNAGFENHDLIVMENITPMAGMQLEKASAKRYTSKVHEYVLVFRKPGNIDASSFEFDDCEEEMNFFKY